MKVPSKQKRLLAGYYVTFVAFKTKEDKLAVAASFAGNVVVFFQKNETFKFMRKNKKAEVPGKLCRAIEREARIMHAAIAGTAELVVSNPDHAQQRTLLKY